MPIFLAQCDHEKANFLDNTRYFFSNSIAAINYFSHKKYIQRFWCQ